MEDWAELVQDIEKSHSETGNSQVQTEIFMRCMKVLSSADLENETHLFCKPLLNDIAGHALIMFSFPGKTSPQRVMAENRMARSIGCCCKCVRGFYTSLAQLKARFVAAGKISVAQVCSFVAIVDAWVFGLVKPQAESILQGIEPVSQENIYRVIYTCLSNAELLRSESSFRQVVAILVSLPNAESMRFDHVLPGFVLYLITGNPAETAFSVRHLSALVRSNSSLDLQVIDEILFHSFRLQDDRFFSQGLSARFWSMLHLIAKVCPPQQFRELLDFGNLDAWSTHTGIRLQPLLRVLCNNVLASLERPLPMTLDLFRHVLSLLGPHIWVKMPAISSGVLLDTVLRSPYFQKQLHNAAHDESLHKNMPLLLGWLPEYLASLVKGPQRQTAAIKIAEFLIQRETHEPGNTRVDSAAMLKSCFDAVSPQSLLAVVDARACVNRHADYFASLARTGLDDAVKLVCACFKYDLQLAAHNSAELQSKKIPPFADISGSLWESVAKVNIGSVYNASAILQALTSISTVTVFRDTKDTVQRSKELDAALQIHNRATQGLCLRVSSLIEKIAIMNPSDLKIVLATKSCSTGLWSCIFNPQTNSAALSVVYSVCDSEGRYENIYNLLNGSLEFNLAAINNTLLSIADIGAFEPCPKGLRILMDIITALTDPLTGILNTQTDQHASFMSVIREFWNSCWRFLDMVYEKTCAWASLYHLSDLIEFTRDTLDASHLLLDSLRVLMDYLTGSNLTATLFETFMSTFTHVIVWLRLGDPSLLSSCVNLVFKGFDFAKELGAHVNENFIITFAKYGTKAKKFNNKLTEQQRSLILSKASEFDAKLVQYVIDETARERDRSSTPSPVPREIREITPEPSQGASYIYQSHNKGPRQATLTGFGVVTKDPPMAPPPAKPFKPNNLEAIRNELKNNRAPVKPPINPAPPRPAGFNHKTTSVGRSLNILKKKHDSDSSEEDEEGDVDVSDLFLDSKKKPKIIELDIHGRPVQKVAQAKKIDTKRQEEERMRLRLNVNLKPLYSTILRWNYNADGEFPTEDREMYKAIKDSYSLARDYVAEMEPLLMLECWQGIQSSRVTGQEIPFELLVGSRTTCDGFFDVYVSMKKSDLVARKIGETDLLVLGYVADKGFKSSHETSQYLKSPDSQTCLAKVREIKFANADYSDITVRVYPQGSMMGLLTPKSIVIGMKVMQMITVEREYSSLKGLQYYDLCDEILSGQPCKAKPISDEEAEGMCGKLGVNISQAKAIIGANREDGFSLIQGPPGTGKTKTILGIVGHFLSRSAVSANTIVAPVSNSSPAPTDAKPVSKVLICAPSNAAVDELVVRLKDGVMSDSGKKLIPKIVRLGRPDAMNSTVRHLSLEELIDSQLKARSVASIDANIRQAHNECISERNKLREKLNQEDLPDTERMELETKLREIQRKRQEIGKQLDEDREKVSIANRTRDIEKRQVQAKILSEAQVICSTLSGSAHDFLASMSMKFDQVIIDEACQCVELSAIIPLRYGCKKCVMVGDPNQLPPTVLSKKAASYKYEESLFVRMQRNNSSSIYLLDVQYRMHPAISRFPSAQFYNSRLSDGPGMLEKNTRPWHDQFPLTPYHFFDIFSRQQQNQQTKSFYNTAEAQVALELVENIIKILPNNQFKGRIGIISPYKEQIRTLREIFQRKFGNLIFNEIDFNTVDGFQGQEKEIIIMSCVRASDSGSVGFLSDVRRMNVALTRARTTLWILGNKSSLRRNEVWNRLITDAESRSAVSKAEPGFFKNAKHLVPQIPTVAQKCQETQQATPKVNHKENETLSMREKHISKKSSSGVYSANQRPESSTPSATLNRENSLPSNGSYKRKFDGGKDGRNDGKVKQKKKSSIFVHNGQRPKPSILLPEAPKVKANSISRPNLANGPPKAPRNLSGPENGIPKAPRNVSGLDNGLPKVLRKVSGPDSILPKAPRHVSGPDNVLRKALRHVSGTETGLPKAPHNLSVPEKPGRQNVVTNKNGAPPRASNSGVYRPKDRPPQPRKPQSSVFIQSRKPHRGHGPPRANGNSGQPRH